MPIHSAHTKYTIINLLDMFALLGDM